MLTDKEISSILNDIVIVSDTREQKNEHILNYFHESDIPYIVEKLDTADYSFILPNYQFLNLDKCVIVEKKNSLDEICGNFTKDRERFTREFERVCEQDVHIVIEGATWRKVLSGGFRSKFPPKSLMASLLTWNARYKCPVWFVGESESPTIIYNLIYYGLREKLKNLK